MEAIHNSSTKPWISELLNVRKFRDEAYEALKNYFDIKSEYDVNNFKERMVKFAKYPEELKIAAQSCSVDLLECPGEEYIEIDREFKAPEGNKLETLRSLEEEVAKMKKNQSYANAVYQSLKYVHYSPNMMIGPRKRVQEQLGASVAIAQPEVILNVQIFRPEMNMQMQHKTVLMRQPNFLVDQEYFVLGSQFLTTLRDIIFCPSDVAVTGDLSENPETTDTVHCLELYRSGFFYINEVFYNDLREPLNKDYSKIIIDWSKTAKQIGPFGTKKMEETRFIDLELKLGYPYVYQHQGYCEHIMVFTNIRLMNSTDYQDINDYPLVVMMQPKRRNFCMVCHKFTAKWVTYGDKRLPETPYFFCHECFMLFNYDINGKKIAEFKAYKYFDKSALL